VNHIFVAYVGVETFSVEARAGRGLRTGAARDLKMRAFKYLRDPLFLACSAAYAVNRWLLKPHFHSGFLHSHFNDVLLIPCALPAVLLLQRALKLRDHDEPPRAGEIVFHLIVWSVLCEIIGPHLLRSVTGDPWDIVSYFAGGTLAGLWWRREQWLSRSTAS